MVNLLPKSAQRTLFATYYGRLATTVLVLAGCAVLAGAVFLTPTYLMIHAEAGDAARYVKTLQDIADQRASGRAAETVTALGESIRLLEGASKDPQLGGALVAVTAGVPKGVSVDALEYGFNEDGTVGVKITGTAATRSALIAYSDQLKATRGLTAVALPVAALVAETNNAFVITAVYKTPQ